MPMPTGCSSHSVPKGVSEMKRQEIHVVFDGPPGPVAGRFVEVENADGASIGVGRWEERGDYWHLIIDDVPEPKPYKVYDIGVPA